MAKWKELEDSFKRACLMVSMTVRSTLEMIGTPRQFHNSRPKSCTKRLNESVRFCALASIAMASLYFVTVSSAANIKQPFMFLLAGGFINFGHMLVVGAIYALAGKIAAWKLPAQVHFENVFYASALLPFVAFLSQPVAHLQLTAMLADQSDFAFGYRSAFDAALANSTLVAWSYAGIAFAYLYFAYLNYVGLRVTTALPRWRTLAAVVPGTFGLFLYQSIVILPLTQLFVRATTR